MSDINIDIQNITQPVSVDIDFKCETNADAVKEAETLAGVITKNAPQDITLNVTRIGQYGCAYLVTHSISCPNVTEVVSYGFAENLFATKYDIPKVTRIYDNVFSHNSSLQVIDLPAVTYIYGGAFNRCTSLNTIILRANSVCTLQTYKILNDTEFKSSGAGGTLYVPQSLIEQYEADANWSRALAQNENNKILSIEGSIYERGGA